MGLLTYPNQIWELTPTKEDLLAGARYAEITLPWTFNRMMKNTGSRGQQDRALNIAKGVVVQEVLRRELKRRGRHAPTQEKSHRDDDLFDFRISIDRKPIRLDVKSIHHYTDYDEQMERTPLTPALIMENMAYTGPDWRYFFPMMVPHTQINQDKQAYCFAIASSKDPRGSIDNGHHGHVLASFPFGESLPFFSSKRLCDKREEDSKGIYLNLEYISNGMFDQNGIEFTVVGEWDQKIVRRKVMLKPGQTVRHLGPFSVIGSFQIDRECYEKLYGKIQISVGRNDLKDAVRNTTRRNVNIPPSDSLVLGQEDFCNLLLPSNYKLYFLGWTTKQDFLMNCRKYPSWVWPSDKVSKYENQPWSQVTERDEVTLNRAGFSDAIQKKPSRINSGWMKTSGRGQGACCYVFPNSHQGGVKETNLYVLPQDLTVMDKL